MAALLAGLAVLVLIGRAPASHRLHRVAARGLAPDRRNADGEPGLSPWLVQATCGLAALAAVLVTGGVVGAAAGAGVLVGGPRVVARLSGQEDEEEDVARDLPLALDLLAACLAGGAVTRDAVDAVAAALPGPCGRRLQVVSARLRVGATQAEAWSSLGTGRGPSGAAARAMARAGVGGAPIAGAVQRIADEARQEASAIAERAARRAGVLAVGPLGLCFLPAFLLVGVVPAVIGLAGPLLSTL
jgi:pilus assembly protein TadC